MKRIATAAGMFFSAVLLVLLAQASAADDLDPKALFEKRCSKCHSLERTNRSETPENWKTLVKKMKGKWFSEISDQDVEVISKYLIENRSKK
jgi:cytochrome c2